MDWIAEEIYKFHDEKHIQKRPIHIIATGLADAIRRDQGEK